MDGSRLKRLQSKLHVDNWQNIDQKQFNDLVTNVGNLDKETVSYILKNIPNVADKILQYFADIQSTMSGKHSDYMVALKDQNELFVRLLDKEQNPATRDKIIDALIDHSKWLRQEASMLRKFKMVFSVIGVGCAFIFAKLILGTTKSEDIRKTNKDMERFR
jgi:hypothetical protein